MPFLDNPVPGAAQIVLRRPAGGLPWTAVPLQRVPEPELMDHDEQARAYAEADFSEPHQRFVELFAERLGEAVKGPVLDLGCGPADVSVRFARAHPDCSVHGLDAAGAMLRQGQKLLQACGLTDRVELFHKHLPEDRPPLAAYATVISNSLLHHLADPLDLWRAIDRHTLPGARVFVMDLMRPDSRAEVTRLTEEYAADAPAVLRHDFECSLLAAYRPQEVQRQLEQTGWTSLLTEVVSDRHLIVYGRKSAEANAP